MRRRVGVGRSVALFGFALLLFSPVLSAATLNPPSLTATAVSSSQINLTWTDPNPNESGHVVERSLSSTSGFVVIASLAKNSRTYSSTGLSAGTTYYFRVKAAAKGNGSSAYSNVANARTLSATGAPAAPSSLTAAAASSSQINLAWTDNSSNETAFKVERASASAGPWAQIGTTAAKTYASSGLSGSTTYYHRVRAYNSYGDSAYSNTASATTLAGGSSVPTAPSSLTATAVSSSQINLNWACSATNETGFKIERSTSTAPWAQIAIVGANVTSYASTGLSASKAYSYRVRTYNGSGNSAYSNTASATTQAASSGGSKWSKLYGSTGMSESGKGVTVDSSGNVVVVGQYQGIVNFGAGLVTSYTNPTGGPTVDAYVAKYSSSGSPVWSRSFGGNASDTASAVTTDSAGNVIVTGYQASSSADYGAGLLPSRGGNDIFVAKYTSGGSYVWAKTIGGTGVDMGTGVAVDTSGNVFVTGHFDVSSGGVNFGGTSLTSAGSRDVFLVKYSAAGAHLWSKRIGGTSGETGGAVGVDGGGNVIVVGNFQGTINCGGANLTSAGLGDLFVAKYSATGQHLWSKRFGGTGNDNVRGVDVDGAGDVVLTGDFTNTINFGGANLTSAGLEDVFLAKLLGASGGHSWSKRFGSTTRTDSGYGVAVDGGGNVAITGFFAYVADFGGGMLSAQNTDIFVAKYSPAGAHISSRRYGDPAGQYDVQYGDAIAMSSGGNIYIAGHFVGTLDLGLAGSLTSTAFGGGDGYLSSLGP